ncbi:MAG: SprT family zinc-dependent metalloprotease [Eubacteriales bacterium]|nr:SprT family zinc-dependent metalloprotease [Eubacteriales bacterium]
MRIITEFGEIEYQVQYGKQKKVTVEVDGAGIVTVKAPNNTVTADIEKIIKLNSKLIIDKLKQITDLRDKSDMRIYQQHGKFLYLGKEVELGDLIETEGLSEDTLKANLEKFYIANCRKVVAERVKIYQKKLGVNPKSVEIIKSHTKWGTCDADKKMTFNLRLVMAPMEIIDYVVVHELCHLTHMNHDRSFWRLLGSVLPDYKLRQDFLLRFGQSMTL